MHKMFEKLKIRSLALIAVFALTFSLITLAPVAHAQVPESAKNAACSGIGTATGANGNRCDSNAASSIRTLLANVLNLLSWIVGVVAIIMVIIGGFKYVASNGDSNGINSAKHTVMYALIGVAVAALAQVLVRFVLRVAAP